MPSRAVLATARYAVYLSVAELVAALYVVTEGLSQLHARLMAYAVLPTFVAGVAVAYASSSLRGRPRGAAAPEWLASAAAWAVALSGLYASLSGYLTFLGWSLVILGASLASLAPLSLRRADVKASVLALGYTQALAGALALAGPRDLYPFALTFVSVEAVGAIYAVTLHSFPSTFGDQPSLALSALSLGLLTLGALTFAWGVRFYQALLGASMLVSLPAFRAHRATGYLAKARTSQNPVARGGMLFFLYGHAFAFGALAAVGAALLGSAWKGVDALVLVHAVTLGVVSMFVLIHAPMMLPVIMGWSSARRYSLAPFVLQAAGAALWPLNMHASFFLVGLAFVLDAMIVKPSREPLPLSLVR